MGDFSVKKENSGYNLKKKKKKTNLDFPTTHPAYAKEI